jgi:hypothetical protein|tara:strand:+ start:534 stop:701 length:168 start_codon:yes stop_codon:yes gene_type:complete
MTTDDLKIYTINSFTLGISMTSLDTFLKISLLMVTIGYTINKWYLLTKKDKDSKN